jgi:hypothetical protein
MNNAYNAMVALEVRRELLLFNILKEKPESLELIIGTSFDKKEKLADRFNKIGKVTKYFDAIPYFCVRCDSLDAQKVANYVYKGLGFYKKDFGAVKSVELANIVAIPRPKVTRAVTKRQSLWNLEDIGAYEARNYSSGRGVKVAVIDTGVNYNHEDIKHCFGTVKGYDFVKNDNNPMDLNGHGTHVAGIIAGVNSGIASGVSMYALRVLDEHGQGSEANAIAAIEWAGKNSIHIVNCSFGAPVASRAFEEMCSYATNWGMMIIAAAGNNGSEIAMYPAAFGEPVTAVAAVDRENKHAYFSNIWPTNDISAPGVDILSSYLDGYAVLDGTSMAAPHVTGTLALAIPFLGYHRLLEEKLSSTAQKLETELDYDAEEVFGAGLVRADLLLKELQHSQERKSQSYRGVDLIGMIKKVVW